MNKLQQMAQQMGQAQQSLQQGDGKQAADAMQQMAQELDKMQQDMNEAEMINMAMEQLEMAKDAMGCKFCNGEGCQDCMGNQWRTTRARTRTASLAAAWARALASESGPRNKPRRTRATRKCEARIAAAPPRSPGWSKARTSRVKLARAIKEEMANLGAEPADPLTSERLPNSRREQAEQYFEMLREGK